MVVYQEGIGVRGAEEKVSDQLCHMESRDIMSNYICWPGFRGEVEQKSANKVALHFYGP